MRTRCTGLATLCAVAALVGAATIAPAASGASTGADHRFSASYTGRGHGQTRGTSASGSATMHGRGRPIGPGTLRGSGSGTATSPTCITFSGKAVLSGKKGSLRLRARQAHACAAAGGNIVSFAGEARVVAGTGIFTGARGRLSFKGSFDRATGAVKISLRGLIRY